MAADQLYLTVTSGNYECEVNLLTSNVNRSPCMYQISLQEVHCSNERHAIWVLSHCLT